MINESPLTGAFYCLPLERVRLCAIVWLHTTKTGVDVDAYSKGWNDWLDGKGWDDNPWTECSESGDYWCRGHMAAEEKAK